MTIVHPLPSLDVVLEREPVQHYYELNEPRFPRPGDRAVCGHVRSQEWTGPEVGEKCTACLLVMERAA